jgi:hypothetical protein
MFEHDGHLVVVARQSGRGATSGVEVASTIVHVWGYRDDRIVSLHADVLFRSGPRVPEAAAAHAAAIHPEAFSAPAG